MNIIVHHPKNKESIDVLRKRVAVVHAEAVVRYIEKLPCPMNQKVKMINSLKEGLQ